MARLPVPGDDSGTWGNLLNEFLSVEHNPDGTLKLSGTLSGKYAKPAGGIPRSHMTDDVQASLAAADAYASTLADLEDTNITDAQEGQLLVYKNSQNTWVNTDITMLNLTKSHVGLDKVDNTSDLSKPVSTATQAALNTKLNLSGGTLSGNLYVQDGKVFRAYHTDNAKYIEVKADAYWSRINAGGTSGFVLTGATVQMDATTSIVTYTPTIRPNTNLGTNIGMASHYYNNLYVRRQYLNTTTYFDGATAGVAALQGTLSISDGQAIQAGATNGLRIATSASQKLGFFGSAPTVQPAGGAAAAGSTYTAAEQAMLNKVYSALRTLGLLS